MKKVIWALIISPLFVAAQENGVRFVQNTSWSALLQQAKAEHKYIFVDCYTTWCGPCKWMDKNIYVNDTVGAAINGQFLAVRVQMDTSRQDAGPVKAWYATAHDIGEKYHINIYPSYLFFSPDGRILHKEVGAHNMDEFLQIVKAAQDPQQQYYTVLARYQQDKDYSQLPYLAGMTRKLREEELEKQIVQDYIHHYLETLPASQLWTKDNLDFIGSHTKFISSTDPLFQWYYRDRKRIDSVMGSETYADRLINIVIYREEVTAKTEVAKKDGTEPNWHEIRRTIGKKYGKDHVEENVLKGETELYRAEKKWDKYVNSFIALQEATNIRTIQTKKIDSEVVADFLNNCAWEIFQYSKDERQLDTALAWVNWALAEGHKPFPVAMDTKANILYKLGKKDEGMQLEEQSYSLAARNDDIRKNYEKMKSGQPTWIAE